MKPFILILIITGIFACRKVDTTWLNAPCYNSCTTVQGRFVTGDNEPIANVSLEIYTRSPGSEFSQSRIVRKIASGKTDNDGNYSFTFGLNGNEYGSGFYHLKLNVKYDKARFLPIPWYDRWSTEEFIPVGLRKDTTVIMDYYLPSKAQLRMQLNNFMPTTTADSFYILPLYHDVGYDKRQTTETQFFVASEVNNEKLIPIAGNQLNKISLVRNKNGIRTVQDTIVYTPTNQITNLTLYY